MHALQVWKRALNDHPKIATAATYFSLGASVTSVLLLVLVLAGIL